MPETKQIRLCGFGGHGIILAGTILGYAGINNGKWVSGSNSYGAAARGGTCHADVVISDKPIRFPHVIKTDILVAMYLSAYNKYIEDVEMEKGLVIYDEQVTPKDVGSLKQVSIPATRVAVRELDNEQVANIVILCAMVEITRIVSQRALVSALETNIPARFKNVNLRAAEIGFKLGKKSY